MNFQGSGCKDQNPAGLGQKVVASAVSVDQDALRTAHSTTTLPTPSYWQYEAANDLELPVAKPRLP